MATCDCERGANGIGLAGRECDCLDDDPMSGDWVECWSCGGDGGHEGDDPFWDLGEWIQCDICRGDGGWIYTPPEPHGGDGGRDG